MITPFGKRVVLERLRDKQSGEIIIPDVVVQRQTARVVRLGSGAPNFEFSVKEGDVVLIHPHHTFDEHEIDGKQCCILREQDLLAIMEGA